jgi:hypothetical protein
MHTHTNRSILVAAGALLIACISPGAGAGVVNDRLALGNWGGENAALIVSDTAMHLHIGCTFGDVSGQVSVGADGMFDVAGSYMLRAYPIQVGPTVPARFVGQVRGTTATITVTVNDTVTHQTVVKGPVSVTLDQVANMGLCPICRRPIHTLSPSG